LNDWLFDNYGYTAAHLFSFMNSNTWWLVIYV